MSCPRLFRAWLFAFAATVLFLLLSPTHAAQARTLAVEPPGDIYCRPNGFQTDEVTVHWKETNSDSGDYKVYRQDIATGDPTVWTELTTIAAADCEDDKCSYIDPNASNATIFRYKVEAIIGNDSVDSLVCREPRFLDDPDGNFRAFYRILECPDINGKQVCAQNTNDDTNQHAIDMAATVQDYLEAYMALNFKDVATYGGDKPYPLDLLPCNNGCQGGSGIQIPPANMEGANYNPNTGGGTPYEIFVMGHELFHQLQGAYGGGKADPFYKWLIEGQARSNEDKTCIFNQVQCDLWDLGDLTYYEGQARSYLGKPEQSLMEASYNAALWWTYVLEQFGTSTAEPPRGMDFMLAFWEQNEANKAADNAKDGIGTLNDTIINNTASPRRFKDIFQDFAVANYAKDYIQNPVPNNLLKYNYIDEEGYPGGTYGVVKKTLTGTLELDQSIFNPAVSVQAWGARYFEVDPDPAIPVINIEVEALPGTPHELYFHVLAIKNGDIVDQWSGSGTSYAESISNAPDYDRIALVVAAMGQAVNFQYGINLADGLFILHPNAQFMAQAGEAASPKKVIVELTVIDENQEPIPDLDTSTFSITVGGVQVNPPLNPGDEAIIASTFVAGQYWVVIRAPANPGCDPCDLTVAWEGYSDTEPDAIDYGPQPAVDNMIVIDRSGSMAGAKIEAAKDAAQLYVDAYDTGDRIGVYSFNDAANLEFDLDEWDAGSRTAAQTAIENMDPPAGNTAIGAGLRAGNQALADQDDPNEAWAMVLLSDGHDTVGDTNDHLPKYIEEYNAAVDDGLQVPVIHVVAVGDDADGVQLEKLTAAANGLFQFLPEGAAAAEAGAVNALSPGLAEIYRVFAEDINDEQQVYAKQFKLAPSSQPVVNNILVDNSASEAIFVAQFVLNGSSSPPSIFLRDPANPGVNVPPTLTTTGHRVWRIPSPTAGIWTLTVRGCPLCDDLVEASLISDLVLEPFLGLPPEERIAGKPMPILALLADVDPITGATMTATSERTGEVVAMHDDGLHGDGAANDGFYGGVLLNTNQAGGYPVIIDANGNSPFAGAFVRRARISFFMAGDGDDDEDRIPNWWEDFYPCVDSKVNDAGKDPDQDKLPNAQEYFRKTNPCDWDTDDGGQGDGSEVGQQKNPRFAPDDGTVFVPSFKAWPSVASVIIRFGPLPTGAQAALYRGASAAGDFARIVDNVDPSGVALDPGRPNDVPVCYYLEITQAEAKALTPISCTTPKVDPHPPHGFVALARTVEAAQLLEARRVRSAQVTLLLDASDIAAEEEHVPFEGDQLLPGAQESGVAEMRISNRADFEDAAYVPYQPSVPWTLAPRPDGLATVFVQFKDAAGNESDVFATSVFVDPDAPLPVDIYLPAIQR